MSISLRGIQNALENKLGELDTLKSHDLNFEFDVIVDEEENDTIKEGVNGMSESKWDVEVQSLKSDIYSLFDSFEKEIDLLNNDGINVDRYNALLQNLKHDYVNICKYIDSRKKRFKLFAKSNATPRNKYQKLYIDRNSEFFDRSQLYKEKNILKDSVSSINSIIDQALNTNHSLSSQKQTLKLIFEKTGTMKKKSINNIQRVVNSIINLQKRQNLVIAIVLMIFIIIIIYFKK